MLLRYILPVVSFSLVLMTHNTSAQNDSHQVINLWPEGVPGLKQNAPAEVKEEGGRISNVHTPSLTVYLADPKISNGTAVIICPGGGYARLAFDHEGIVPAKWFNAHGVTAFIIKNRLKEYGHPAPLQDILRAIRTVRSRASEFSIKADRIGVLGFSAGGHLAASSGTLFNAPEGKTGAPLDAIDARPNFLMLLYPVITFEKPYAHIGSRTNLIGAHPTDEAIHHLSLDQQVSKDTPPSFIVQTEEDKTVPVENSILFYQALRKYGVPAELHLYAKGPHGFGMRPDLGPASEWPDRLESWMKSHGWLTKE